MVAYTHRDGWSGCKPAAKRSLARSVLLAFRIIAPRIGPTLRLGVSKPAKA
jgi:hypothetical protein